MDQLFGEIKQARAAMGMDGDMPGGPQPGGSGFNPYAGEPNGGMGARPSAAYSDEELMHIYEQIQSGQCAPELKELFNKMASEQASKGGAGGDGKAYVDKEGGTVIQPSKGFVVKTKDVKTGGKMFINMAHHEIVDPFESKAIPKEQQEEHGAQEKGLRIPLSLGDLREESDKKGDPAQVIDVIWAPVTIEKAKRDPAFRQVVVELAFNYILQKHNIELDLRYTVPKLNYKGATVQFQRVRAKKAPKIQEVELTQEQREEMERKNLEEQKLKESMQEKKPTWQLLFGMNSDDDAIMTKEYWLKLIEDQFEQKVGEADDRWNDLRESFKLSQELGVFEEFDGLNHEDAKYMVLHVALPLLVRGNSVQMRIYEDLFSLRVPNIYKLQLSLPVPVEHEDCLSFFDCKLRRMFIVAPIPEPKIQEMAPEAVEEATTAAPGRADEEQKVEAAESQKITEVVVEETVADESSQAAAAAEEDDLLFDVV